MKILNFLVIFLAAAAFAGPIEDLQPNCWYEVPNSHLDDCPEKAAQAQFPWLTSMFGAIIDVWCGGVFDTQRDVMLVGPGGGHASYNGNEVYGFSLNAFTWKRLTNPDFANGECTADSVPFAMHTYDGGDYLPPPIDRYLLAGGWCTSKTYALDFGTRHWETFVPSGLSRTGDQAAYDPWTGAFLYVDGMSGRLGKFNYTTGQWTVVSSGASTYYATATFDAKRRLLVSVGGGKVRVWDMKTNPVTYSEPSTTGDATMVSANNPGTEYDHISDRVVCWWSGADIYSLNTDTWAWTKHNPASGNTVIPPAPQGNGTYGRFRYVPSKNVFVLVNHVGQNVLIYRLTAGTPVIPVSLNAAVSSGTVETDLSYSVTGTAAYSDNSSKNITDSLFLRSLTPNTVAVTGGHTFKALAAGSATLIAGYTDRRLGRAVYDTLTFTVQALSGSVVLDSIVLNYSAAGVMVNDSTGLHATGYYSRSGDHFIRNIDDDATWTSSSPSNLMVNSGMVKGAAAGGPFDVAAALSGKSDTAKVTVYTDPPITRINFQISSTPWKTGWLADNGGAYSDANGYGWTSGSGFSTRDDRLGANFLLKSLVATPGECNYKVKLPDGRYILRLGLGDNQWGSSFTYIRMGTDTLCTFVSGANSITTNLVDVTGGNGLVLAVNGSINYLVVMADNGMDINRYADDGYTPPPLGVNTLPMFAAATPFSVFPNPFNTAITLEFSGIRHLKEVSVYDTHGRKVADLTAQALRGRAVWRPDLPSGMYVARFVTGNRVVSKPLILIK